MKPFRIALAFLPRWMRPRPDVTTSITRTPIGFGTGRQPRVVCTYPADTPLRGLN